MDAELTKLLVNYKSCLEDICEINNKAAQVTVSEELIASNEKTPEKVVELLEKVKLDIDTTQIRQTAETRDAKKEIQYYIDNVLWNCSCRTSLEPTEETDKERMLNLLSALFRVDSDSTDQFYENLHDWIIQISTVYVTVYRDIKDREQILLFLLKAPHATWAVPLIQLSPENDIVGMCAYVDIVSRVFTQAAWKDEEDYLAVLDQLAIDYVYCRLCTSRSESDTSNLFRPTKLLIDALFEGTRHTEMNSLSKRLCQTIVRISLIFVENMGHDQDQIDLLLLDIFDIFHASDITTVWMFLPQFPVNVASTHALWLITLKLLYLPDFAEPASLESFLSAPPDLSQFKAFLQDSPIHSTFILSCLSTISTSIPSGVDQLPNHNMRATYTLILISLSLFHVAFIDTQLRNDYYRDVRDHFELVCQHHPFITSLLLRWTVEHMDEMQNMALYLFHSLPIESWTILSSDLKRLHQIIQPERVVDVQLAKYIIENLNYGYTVSIDTEISRSQPWHSRRRPFLGYDIHEDLAFLILDACQRFQPIKDTAKGTVDQVASSVVSNYMKNHDADDFIQWSWKMIQRLKLYDCPVSTRATQLEASLTPPFVRSVLNNYNDTTASHSALIIYVSFMLSATSRHFLCFDSGRGWLKMLTILKRGPGQAVIQMMSEMIPSFVYMHGDDLFNDSSLSDFLKHTFMVKVQMEPILGATLWQAKLIDDSVMEQGSGFSYVDLMIHCWLKTIFRRPEWVHQKGLVALLDTLCKWAFVLKQRKLIHPMLMEEYRLCESQVKESNASTENSPKLAQMIKNMVYEGVPTLLLGNDDWFKSIYRGLGVDNQHLWFAFEALLAETKGQTRNDPKRPFEFFVIYRWVQHILVIPMDHTLLPLYLQMFFSLYYQPLDERSTLGSLFSSKKPEILSTLRDFIASVQTYFGQKMVVAPDVAERFQQIYYAMWLWLGHGELLKPHYDVDHLPSHYMTDRLLSCYSKSEDEQPWQNEERFWLDLVDRERLLQGFMEHSWASSERFRTSSGIKDDSSVKSKRSKMTISEPNNVCLPPITFREPNKT